MKLPGKNLHVSPGETINLPPALAIKFLERAKGKVRVLEPPLLAELTTGARVMWDSPLFGQCSGEVALCPENGWLVVRGHSVTGNLALIHVDWIRRVQST